MKDKSKIRVCKKCQKELPEGYKYKCCEACRNKKAFTAKKMIKGVGEGAVFALSVVAFVVTRGKKSG